MFILKVKVLILFFLSVISLLRLLTEVEIRARGEQYEPFFTDQKTAIEVVILFSVCSIILLGTVPFSLCQILGSINYI
jgi:hypothetical protein